MIGHYGVRTRRRRRNSLTKVVPKFPVPCHDGSREDTPTVVADSGFRAMPANAGTGEGDRCHATLLDQHDCIYVNIFNRMRYLFRDVMNTLSLSPMLFAVSLSRCRFTRLQAGRDQEIEMS